MSTPKSFADFGLSKDVLDALASMGFESPTDIQVEAIPPLLAGRDVIGQAKTGTGKTAAFGVPLVHRADGTRRKTQALVLVPTRELAEQVCGEVNEIGQFKGVHATAIYGGAGFGPQIQDLKDGVQVVVGTPGRIMDHMRRGNLKLDHVSMFVLDEADRMLDMGFIDDIKWVLARTPRGAQKLLFSATMPMSILNLAKEVMRNPLTLMVSEDDLTIEGVDQVYYNVGYRNKVWALYRVLEAEKPALAFVFCRTKMEADKVWRLLEAHGFNAEALHGDMTQSARNKVMENVRESKTKILVATDVLARGIDVTHCSHVINYDIPEDPEWYVHRIGRTGRMGRLGKAITFVTREESRAILDIENAAGTKVVLQDVPEPEHLLKDAIKRVMDWKELADPTGMVKFRLDLGARDGVRMIDLFRAVNKKCGFQESTLGGVLVKEDHTVVEVPHPVAGRFWNAYQSGKILERPVKATIQDRDA